VNEAPEQNEKKTHKRVTFCLAYIQEQKSTERQRSFWYEKNNALDQATQTTT
jgi:hypothetical protein